MFQSFLGTLGEMFLPKVEESFWSNVVELTASSAVTNMKNIIDFKPNLETLEANMKLLIAKASDVQRKIKNGEDSGRKKRKREVEEWLEQVKSFEKETDELRSRVESQGFIMRFMEGGKAAELNEQVLKLFEQARGFRQLLYVCGTSGDSFLTDGMVGEAFSENLGRIMGLLESRKVSRIGVYGMGGVGKTTLAKHVNNRLLQQQEGRVVWVAASQELSIKSLQDKIAHCMHVDLSDENDEDMRATRLHKALSQEKISVLILDALWEYIDMKKVGCNISVDGCRLIITTRSLEVCRRIGCQEEILVKKLDEGEAWKLFKERLGIGIEIGPQVEKIAKSVVNLCGGLPLAIITTARSMRGKTSIHTWKNAFVELQERVVGHDSDEVFKVLQYSFDRLKKRNDTSHEFNTIQLCFLYCSLYPEDHEMHRDHLVRNFISAGLMSQKRSRRARVQQGLSILDELVNVCLLEKCVNPRVKECVKMHNLVRDMALKISKGKYMVRAGVGSLGEMSYREGLIKTVLSKKALKIGKGKYIFREGNLSWMEIPNQEEWTHDLEKVSIILSDIKIIEDGISPDCPKLSTLLLWGNDELSVISESFFSKMQGLCTLDLSGSDVERLPNSISDLKSLNALVLENCEKLEIVPYLGKLKALRELNLSGTAIKEVPQGVEKLLKLEFLAMDAKNLVMLPSGLLLKLVRLQHVSIPFHLQAPMEEIQNLKLLEEFNGSVERVEEFNCFMRNGKSRRERDTWYTIAIIAGQHHEEEARDFESSCYEKKLGLFGCNLEDERVLGQDTEYVRINECEGLSISLLDDFSGLKKLRIDGCGGIEWILRSDGQGSHVNTLEDIYLQRLDDVKGVVMERGKMGPSTTAPMQPPVFSSLRRLAIHNCNKMRKVGLPVSDLPNLEYIHISSCEEIEEILEEDEGRAASTVTLPKLKQSTFHQLPKLKSVSKATIICNSIEKMRVIKCPRLMKKLPLHFGGPTPPPTLREIWVEREWWESLEWEININPNLPQLLLPFLHFED